jgi:hypothetical protein
MLRRLAHWMMGEPDLEEEALVAIADGQTLTVTRRTLADAVGDVTVTYPDGTEALLTLSESAPGRYSAEIDGAEQGLYRLTDGTLETVIALGPAAPREFEETIASADRLLPLIEPAERCGDAAGGRHAGYPPRGGGAQRLGPGLDRPDDAGGLSDHRCHDHAACFGMAVPSDGGGPYARRVAARRAELNRPARRSGTVERRMQRCRRDFRQLP